MQAKTKYVVFVENDVVVERGWLGALIRCAEEEQADIVSPLCLIGDPSDRNVHSLGGLLLFENRAGATLLQGPPFHVATLAGAALVVGRLRSSTGGGFAR